MAKSDELVKYITQQVTRYLDTPKEIRKQVRLEQRVVKVQESWQHRWFGMLPFAIKMWADGRRKKKETPTPRD
ncbi:YqzE family protein [Paenibacillus sp. MBLB4367]|uniref:YqzE family protein n=1 Tax=Paenibacillus sp. MBLB4367 TaxID=3384767 RepID=UPI0039083726